MKRVLIANDIIASSRTPFTGTRLQWIELPDRDCMARDRLDAAIDAVAPGWKLARIEEPFARPWSL